jgi:hypothetical protein
LIVARTRSGSPARRHQRFLHAGGLNRWRDLDVGLTTLAPPDEDDRADRRADPARVLAWATDYSGLLVSVPRNERRTGEVTFSFDDPICQHLFRDVTENVTGHTVQISTLLEVMLFVRWRGTPILWAPIVTWTGGKPTAKSPSARSMCSA